MSGRGIPFQESLPSPWAGAGGRAGEVGKEVFESSQDLEGGRKGMGSHSTSPSPVLSDFAVSCFNKTNAHISGFIASFFKERSYVYYFVSATPGESLPAGKAPDPVPGT